MSTPPLTNIQKAPNTPISQAAMNEIATVRTHDEMTLDFPWDITSPEGIIAFFGAKMQATDADLKKHMYSQQARNAASSAMKDMKGLLDRVGDSGRLEPGTPDYAEFKRLAAEVEGSLGGSADEKALKASIDSALSPGYYEKQFDTFTDTQALADFKAAHPDAHHIEGKDNFDGPVVRTEIWATDHAAKVIDPDTAKGLGTQLTSMTDNYSSANQLEMITVQDLVNQISQITSLASNIVHSFNEAAMGPIANIK
jgi:hypothetical protein